MNYSRLLKLHRGDKVSYTDINGEYRTLEFIRINDIVPGVHGEDTPSLEWYDENGRIMHTPYNVWLIYKYHFKITLKDESTECSI